MNKTPPDDLFAELGEAWRQDSAPSIDDLNAGVERSLWIGRLRTWLEIIIATAGTLFGVWIWSQGDAMLGGACVAFAGTSLLLVLDFRRREHRAITEPVSEQLRALYQLERGRYQRGWVGIVVCLLAFAFLVFVVVTQQDFPQAGSDTVFLAAMMVFVMSGVAISTRQITRGRVACERIRQWGRD